MKPTKAAAIMCWASDAFPGLVSTPILIPLLFIFFSPFAQTVVHRYRPHRFENGLSELLPSTEAKIRKRATKDLIETKILNFLEQLPTVLLSAIVSLAAMSQRATPCFPLSIVG